MNTNLEQFKQSEPFCSSCGNQCDWEDCWHCNDGTDENGEACEICMSAGGWWCCFNCLPEESNHD